MSTNHKVFELTTAHIALVKALIITPEKLSLVGSKSKISPFSNGLQTDTSLVEDIAMIIVGKEPSDEEKKIMNEEGTFYYTRDNEESLLKIYEELPTAIEVIFNTSSFEEGKYRTRHYEIDWKKIK